MASDTDIEELTLTMRQLTETIDDLLNYGRSTMQDNRGRDSLDTCLYVEIK